MRVKGEFFGWTAWLFRVLIAPWCRGVPRVVLMPEALPLPPTTPSDIPDPSVELTLIAVMIRAHLRTLKPKARREYLRTLAEVMAEFEADQNVVRLRGRKHDAAVTRTRRESAAWMRAVMGAFFIADGQRL